MSPSVDFTDKHTSLQIKTTVRNVRNLSHCRCQSLFSSDKQLVIDVDDLSHSRVAYVEIRQSEQSDGWWMCRGTRNDGQAIVSIWFRFSIPFRLPPDDSSTDDPMPTIVPFRSGIFYFQSFVHDLK